MLDGQRHRQHLAENHEQHGHGPDGDGQADGSEELRGHGRRESRRGDVDEGDADQQCDEEIVWPGEERSRCALLGSLLLGQPLESRAPEREIGRLGTSQEGGKQDERPEAHELPQGHQTEDAQAIH
jgi:hypothetical protein